MQIVTTRRALSVLVKGSYPAQDGGIATTTCPHGLEQSGCLICKTLPGTALADPGGAVRPDRVYAGGRAPVARHRSIGTHMVMVVAGIALIGLVAWLLAGAVFAILHVAELVLVAAVAGWGGYRLGRFRGRRER